MYQPEAIRMERRNCGNVDWIQAPAHPGQQEVQLQLGGRQSRGLRGSAGGRISP